jgi:hypothetical protein
VKLSNRYFCNLSDLERANFLALQLVETGYCVATFNDLQNEFIFEVLADISRSHFGACSLHCNCSDPRIKFIFPGYKRYTNSMWFVTVATNIEDELIESTL